tara:strand:+ start:582 stop:752 length:171 start_codon:yes stop_codon:yes gene_type:complete
MSTICFVCAVGGAIILILLEPSDNVTTEGYAMLGFTSFIGFFTGIAYLTRMVQSLK